MKPNDDKIIKYVETAPQPIKDVWNAAIDAAVKLVDAEGRTKLANEILRLKK